MTAEDGWEMPATCSDCGTWDDLNNFWSASGGRILCRDCKRKDDER